MRNNPTQPENTNGLDGTPAQPEVGTGHAPLYNTRCKDFIPPWIEEVIANMGSGGGTPSGEPNE